VSGTLKPLKMQKPMDMTTCYTGYERMVDQCINVPGNVRSILYTAVGRREKVPTSVCFKCKIISEVMCIVSHFCLH
jgi:hypothetical protein